MVTVTVTVTITIRVRIRVRVRIRIRISVLITYISRYLLVYKYYINTRRLSRTKA